MYGHLFFFRVFHCVTMKIFIQTKKINLKNQVINLIKSEHRFGIDEYISRVSFTHCRLISKRIANAHSFETNPTLRIIFVRFARISTAYCSSPFLEKNVQLVLRLIALFWLFGHSAEQFSITWIGFSQPSQGKPPWLGGLQYWCPNLTSRKAAKMNIKIVAF